MDVYIPSEVFVHFTEKSRHINKRVMTLATTVLLRTLVDEESSFDGHSAKDAYIYSQILL